MAARLPALQRCCRRRRSALPLLRAAAGLGGEPSSSSNGSASVSRNSPSDDVHRPEPQQLQFVYQSEAAAAEAAAQSEAARAASLQEYERLKEYLLFRTWRFGMLFAGYLLLAASAEVRAGSGGEAGGGLQLGRPRGH